MIEKLNSKLRKSSQKLRVIEYSPSKLVLSNGFVINSKYGVISFRRRLLYNTTTSIYIDVIYTPSGVDCDVIEYIKLKNCINGGKLCQKYHGDKIRLNLNTLPPWNKGLTKETDNRVKSISDSKIGSLNPMYGKIHTDETKSHLSKIMKDKILNGEFTPNIHNSNTHWQCEYNNQKYRSSWELVWHYLNPSYEYETLRLPYIYNGFTKIYITDFINHDDKVVVEIKPSSHHDNNQVKDKIQSAIRWCDENGYTFKIIDESFIYDSWDSINLSLFDTNVQKNITKAYETYIKKNNIKTQ